MGREPGRVLDEAGFTATLATNSEFEIERYLRLGDVIASTQEFGVDLRGEADLARPGHFVTWLTTYTDQSGEVVGRQRFRILKFKAGGN